jgi:reactive intermediate/imine deaminase
MVSRVRGRILLKILNSDKSLSVEGVDGRPRTVDGSEPTEPEGGLLMRMFTAGVSALLIIIVTACGGQEPVAPQVEFLNSPAAAGRDLPFSEAVRVGHMLFLSGQLGTRPGTTELVPGGIAAETKQVLENMRAILERNGSSLDRVVKCTVFLADIGEWPAMNEVYRQYFSGNPPARSAMAASGLALNARVEIECIAVVGDPARRQ